VVVLEEQLTVQAEVTVIASGVQVLPPTDQRKLQPIYCSDDSHSGGGHTFQDSIKAVGEGKQYWHGTSYEDWGEIPQERARLLGLAQRALNQGNTRAVVFVSGDQHWGELLAKRMPGSEEFGEEQVLYEVTASGVYKPWSGENIKNGNRLRRRSCDHKGKGPFNQACVFPFKYLGTTYSDCAPREDGDSWCSTKTDLWHDHIAGYWGNCAPKEEELAQTVFSNSTKTCSQSDFYICSAQANYGYIDVNFSENTLRMGIKTPEEKEEMYHEIHY